MFFIDQTNPAITNLNHFSTPFLHSSSSDAHPHTTIPWYELLERTLR